MVKGSRPLLQPRPASASGRDTPAIHQIKRVEATSQELPPVWRGTKFLEFPFEPRKTGWGVPPSRLVFWRSDATTSGVVVLRKSCTPIPPTAAPWRKRKGARGELFALFVEKTGGGVPLPFPATPDVAVRQSDEQSNSGRGRPRAVRSSTVEDRRSMRNCNLESDNALIRAIVRPFCRWGTELFSPLISFAFLPARWRMAVDAVAEQYPKYSYRT
jgi:hypothetical protein